MTDDRAATPPLERDLAAYVDNELPMAERIAVEAYLSTRPALAARVIADLRLRDELRFAFSAPPATVRLENVAAARRLEAGLGRAVAARRGRGLAAAVLLIGIGWLAHDEANTLGIGSVSASAGPPAFLAEAIAAHRAAATRPAPGTAAGFDPAAIRATTGIALPPLPEGWYVAAARILPSAGGPTVELAIEAAGGRPISLFALRPGVFDVVPATHADADGVTASYWQIGEVAYAVVADRDGGVAVDTIAEDLARSLY